MLALIALLAAGPARGAAAPQPWSGGAQRMTPFERTLTTIAGSLAGGGASIECVTPAAWYGLAARDAFDPETTWGTTPLEEAAGAVRPLGRSNLAPRTCAAAAAFSRRPTEMGSRICRHGTTWRWTAASARPGTSPARNRVRVALLGECDGWASKLVAVHVIAHETMHLADVVDEASADCVAVQLDAFVAMQLGAGATFARSLAQEYWRLYYPAQDPRYRSAECRDGGALDLFRDRTGWPTPTRYPSDLRLALGSFSASVESGATTSLASVGP
jgi:hypothetical protein